MSLSRNRPASDITFRLPRRSLLVMGVAFGAGLLLFVAVWLAGRDDGFYTAPPREDGTPAAVLEALPAPLPAGDGASGMEVPREPREEVRPQLVEAPPTPPADAPLPAPVDGAASAPAGASAALAPGEVPVPIPGQTPPPDYPVAAMRSGETGTVMVRVEVGTDGVPLRVEVEQRSGSRDLDRAAVEAVRRWRFNPAQHNGQPIVASVVIPIDFNLQ
ncbi:energy transducer TonB [Pseudoxanthomonas mexicana]|uniref:energy transducer TonB n=1 Tax=Pseudoxanthomonas mexicana TaxID=128785 RepID=UPI00398B01FE